MGGTRAERIARIIREEASRVILYELADPRIGFVTVTKVKVSDDLQYAKVFFSVLGEPADRRRTVRALESASPVVRRAIGPRLRMRLMPQIVFEFDESIEGAARVSRLIREARATDIDGGGSPASAPATDADAAAAPPSGSASPGASADEASAGDDVEDGGTDADGEGDEADEDGGHDERGPGRAADGGAGG